MKYKIVTNGTSYRIKCKTWWWPFWYYAWYPNEGGWCYLEYETIEGAKSWIERKQNKETVERKPWKEVESVQAKASDC